MQEINITVQTEKELKAQGDLFGIFFEDLNHAADGGLYGELVRNRSFEFDRVDSPEYHAMTAWSLIERGESVAQAHTEISSPMSHKNPHYLVLEVLTPGEGGGICNEGYHAGIPIESGKEYYFSCFCRLRTKKNVPLSIRLENSTGTICYAEETILLETDGWKKYEQTLKPAQTDYEGRLVLLVHEKACIEFDMISLFPEDTFGRKKNGLRNDLAQMLKEMKPKFMRFPGGCLTHIGSLNMNDRCCMYRWKNTVGPVELRPSKRNIWNYNQTFGLGFYEFFSFCEEIGAEPIPVLSAGYDTHYLRMADMENMQEWIDEALDLIEFANGSAETKWGAVRAQMGHPESFHMKYLAIGNEEVGDEFFERYEVIARAVKKTHPEIQVIDSAGPGSGGSEFIKGWEQARRTDAAFVDEHFYQNPEWFWANADRYDSYAGKPKAFLGEYASHDDTWKNALAEAAFMTGMEKAPGVGLACYAPMLCNVNYCDWKPVLLYYNNHQVYGSPSYYVQKLFMNYQGEKLLAASDNLVRKEKEAPLLHGEIALSTNQACIDVKKFQFTDHESGIVKELPGSELSSQCRQIKYLNTASSHYEVVFQFCKKNGSRSGNLSGSYSFDLEFARRDEQNKLKWTIDGWQRLTCLKGLYQGFDCDMGLYFFEAEKDRVYEARLLVDGSCVKTFINGKEYCSHICRTPEPEELYYSAVKEKDGTVIVKAVNAENTPKAIQINLQGDRQLDHVQITAMAGFRLDDRNSFEKPEKVAPAVKQELLHGNSYRYILPEHSLAVLCFQ